MNINSRTSKVNFIGNAAGPVASFTAYRSSKASIMIDDHYFTPADNKANVCNTPMPVSQLWNIDSLFKGHVEFNQLVQNGNFADGITGWTFNNLTGTAANNEVTVTVTSGTKSVNFGLANANAVKRIIGHKYFCGFSVYRNVTLNKNLMFNPDGNSYLTISVPDDTYVRVETIISATTDRNRMFVYPWSTTTSTFDGTEIAKAKNYVCFDLTQMFGSTIADYIYNLEQSTAGAGVAFFRSIYPNDYYDYDTGTDEMVGSREGSIITLPIDIKTSFIPNIGSNNIFADCGYVDVDYVTI